MLERFERELLCAIGPQLAKKIEAAPPDVLRALADEAVDRWESRLLGVDANKAGD